MVESVKQRNRGRKPGDTNELSGRFPYKQILTVLSKFNVKIPPKVLLWLLRGGPNDDDSFIKWIIAPKRSKKKNREDALVFWKRVRGIDKDMSNTQKLFFKTLSLKVLDHKLSQLKAPDKAYVIWDRKNRVYGYNHDRSNLEKLQDIELINMHKPQRILDLWQDADGWGADEIGRIYCHKSISKNQVEAVKELMRQIAKQLSIQPKNPFKWSAKNAGGIIIYF
jgi:hypothetical protein